MSLFLLFGKYAPEALGKISAERSRQGTEIVQALGGKLNGIYATLGEYDIVAVVELPGVEAAMKASIQLRQALGISFTTAPAITVEAFDKLMEK